MVKKKGLTEDSLPHEWFEALLPVTPMPADPASSVLISVDIR